MTGSSRVQIHEFQCSQSVVYIHHVERPTPQSIFTRGTVTLAPPESSDMKPFGLGTAARHPHIWPSRETHAAILRRIAPESGVGCVLNCGLVSNQCWTRQAAFLSNSFDGPRRNCCGVASCREKGQLASLGYRWLLVKLHVWLDCVG